MVTYLVAIHNNSVLLLAFGLPFDRALPWHKMLAFSSLFNAVIHAAAFYYGDRAQGLPWQPDPEHHIYTHLTRAYGMEITGARSDGVCLCGEMLARGTDLARLRTQPCCKECVAIGTQSVLQSLQWYLHLGFGQPV